ncbi:MAG: hypothetical protein IPM74_12340 [Crocinitomicaceae bacterium]|nr:hypothetical protein [Crocinitomicaceae bacterium]MBK8926664.1 hypothetical protein [Crocinitomicaceae bacterium]
MAKKKNSNSTEESRSENDSKFDREIFQRAIESSENDFEKNLTYISAGSLGLSLAFIEKIVPLEFAKCKIFLILGWTLLTITLATNLASHLISIFFISKSRDDYDSQNKDSEKNVKSRNKIISGINWATLVLLILGIGSIVYFSSINIICNGKG